MNMKLNKNMDLSVWAYVFQKWIRRYLVLCPNNEGIYTEYDHETGELLPLNVPFELRNNVVQYNQGVGWVLNAIWAINFDDNKRRLGI